jgi:hypothetical protein
VAFHAGIMPSPFVALIYSTLAIWARVVSYALEHAAALLLGLASDAAPASSPLPTVFVNIQVLNREQKLAEVEVKTKAEVQQNLNHLGPLGSWAADLAGKTAAGLTKMAVSNEDLGMSVGVYACQCSTGLLQQIGVQSEAEVVYAEASLAVVQCSMVKVDLPTLVKAVTSQSEVGIGIARVWGFCWDACNAFGLGAFFERATEARIGEFAAFSMTQLLSAELEKAVREQMGGLEVAVTTVQSTEQAAHFFRARQALLLPVAVTRSV